VTTGEQTNQGGAPSLAAREFRDRGVELDAGQQMRHHAALPGVRRPDVIWLAAECQIADILLTGRLFGLGQDRHRDPPGVDDPASVGFNRSCEQTE